MPSERPLIVSEGNWLDDADRMLMSKQVDFREPRDRYSVSTLVKLGESQRAPGRLRTIRISKPEFFRRGRDPNETRAQQSTEHVDDIDEPEGLAQLRAAEVNRAAELVDSRIRVTADGMRVRRTHRRKTTNTISLRNHGWIYCTAIEPTSDEEWRDLKAMMPSEYDHASYIYRPRAFALALGSMLADRFGIRGGEVQVDARIADLHASSRRGSQTIFHGPVVYEQDRFARFTSPRNEFEAFLGKIFIKDKCLEAEREYRFAIWSEDEPVEDHVDLRISLAMREAMLPLITPSRETYQETDSPDSSAPDVPQVPRDLPPAAKLSELTSHEPALPDPLELLSDPSVGVRPHMLGTEPPAGAEDRTMRRRIVSMPGGRPGPRRPRPSYVLAISCRCQRRRVSGVTRVCRSRRTRRPRRVACAARRRRWASVTRRRPGPSCSRRTRCSSWRESMTSRGCWWIQPATATTRNCNTWGKGDIRGEPSRGSRRSRTSRPGERPA